MAVVKSRREELLIVIAGATGLRNADWSPFTQDKSDPYCICQVVETPDKVIKTKTIQDSLDPVWNHVQKMDNFVSGEALSFTVWDEDIGKKDDKLGHAKLESSSFLPHGFVGRLFLQAAGNTTAAIYVLILPLPILSGELDVMRMRSLEPRFFVLQDDALLYFTDSEDFETGMPERGSIMLSDVETFEVDKNGTLVFHLYRLPHPVQVHCRGWEEASKWGAAIDRVLLRRGASNEQELVWFSQASICEGHMSIAAVEGGGKREGGTLEDPVYVVLLPDMIVGYKDYMTFRKDRRSSLWAEPTAQISQVTAEESDSISITMAGKAIKLWTKSWEDTMMWGQGFLQVADHAPVDTPQEANKVDWRSFQKVIVYEGTLHIMRGTGPLSRYFIMYGDHLAYFNAKEDFESKKKQHGAVDFRHVTKVICGNETTLTIKLMDKTVFQLQEVTPGTGALWADNWDKVLKMRGLGPVVRFDWGGVDFDWDFLVGEEGEQIY